MREVIVFTKVPERGKVKTRLQKRYSSYQVEELYTAFLLDTLEKLREFYPYVAYWPPDKLQPLWMIIGERKYAVQRGKDFGEKIQNIFRDFYKMGIRNTVAVGCDVPTLTKKHIEDAFKLMGDHDLVVGPANDGGFYLIGGAGVKKELFEGVNWEGKNVLDSVLSNAAELGLKVGKTQTLLDIDTPENLDALWKLGELDERSNTYRVVKKMLKR